jgi:hypothetical protein
MDLYLDRDRDRDIDRDLDLRPPPPTDGRIYSKSTTTIFFIIQNTQYIITMIYVYYWYNDNDASPRLASHWPSLFYALSPTSLLKSRAYIALSYHFLKSQSGGGNRTSPSKNGAGCNIQKSPYCDPAIFSTQECENCKLCSRQVECAKTRFKSKTAKPGFGHFWKNTILPILS